MRILLKKKRILLKKKRIYTIFSYQTIANIGKNV